MFEVSEGLATCPFCSAQIPQDLDAMPSDSTVGSALDPLAPANPPVPTPGGVPEGATPDPMLLEGTFDPAAPVVEPDVPPSVEAAQKAGKVQASAGGPPAAVKLALIAGGGFLAFKLGLLDNLLSLAGMNPAPPPPAPVAPAEPPAAPAAPEPAPALPAAPETPGQGGPIAAPAEPSPAPAPAPAEWSFEGRVTDILTMKPVKGAVLLFMTQAEDETFEARSDAKGHWSLKVPVRKDGFKLVIDHPEYIAEYFDEADPPYRTWTLAKRRQLRAAKPSHKPWKAAGAEAFRRDLLLFPDITDR